MKLKLHRLALLLTAFAVTGAMADPQGATSPTASDLALDLGEVPVPNTPSPPRQAAAPAGAASAPTGMVRGAPAASNGAPTRAASSASGRTTALGDMPAGLGFDNADAVDAEHVVFQRAPVRIVLPLKRERLITFPGTVALHAPEGFESLVQSQIIERTAYVTALSEFGSLRVVAEDLNTGRQIPIDLVVDANTKTALRPIDVIVPSLNANGSAADDTGAPGARPARTEPPTLDMVALTRHAALSLYAPRRLVPAAPGVKQLPIATVPVEGIYRGNSRGWRVQTTPIGAWRSGQLYVTAVRFTNQGQQALDIDLQEMRGHWLAATAQHTRLLAAGSDWDTTTVYLVCDRPFEACR